MKKIIFAILVFLLMVVSIARATMMENNVFGWEDDERITIEFIDESKFFGPEEHIIIGDKYEVVVMYKEDYSGGWISMTTYEPGEYGYSKEVLYESEQEPMNMGLLGLKIDELVKEGLDLLDNDR